MDAKQVFESLGYIQSREDDDYILYEKEIDNGEDLKIVSFCDQLRNVKVYYESEMDTPSIDMELFKAISMQIKELGW